MSVPISDLLEAYKEETEKVMLEAEFELCRKELQLYKDAHEARRVIHALMTFDIRVLVDSIPGQRVLWNQAVSYAYDTIEKIP